MAHTPSLYERLLNFIDRRRPLPGKDVVNRFHRLYYDSSQRTWRNTFWMGVPVAKCPLDLWVYQEVFKETRPDLVIETGTAHGGSALYMAHLFDLIGSGRVVTVDIERHGEPPAHPRITHLLGSSTSAEIIERVTAEAASASRVCVVLDSDHSREHVLAELRAYAPLVTPGCYLVVEDTNVHGHPVFRSHGPGPMEAVELFLKERSDFAADASREKFFMTFNPSGYLKRL